MNRWSFLSLAPQPWIFSLGFHLVFLGLVLFVNRIHPLDLSVVSLDMLTAKNSAAAQPPPEDLWQKPMLRRMAKLPPPKPTVVPTPQVGAVGDEGPVRSVAEVSQLPHFKVQVQAVYPETAKHSGIEGVVMLQVDLNAEGQVTDVQVIKGIGFGCDEAAVSAMKQSIFTPAYEGLIPVPVRIKIPYRFKING